MLKPKFFIPCHGEFRHLKAHANIAQDLGMHERNIVIPDLGDRISISPNSIKKLGTVPAGIKLIDGMDISEANGVVQRDRMQLASEGICIVILTISSKTATLTSKPDIITRGFMYSNDANNDILEDAKTLLINTIVELDFKSKDWGTIKASIRKSLMTYFFKNLKRKPVIIPVIVETN